MKSCVGSTWCRYGVQDSVGFAIDIENRYKGLRAPHKLKFAVSGCTRECAEAQSKDVGVIATEKGWNLYVCGNGGMKPRHADLLAGDLDSATLIRYIDRFLMFYIRTADRLQRTVGVARQPRRRPRLPEAGRDRGQARHRRRARSRDGARRRHLRVRVEEGDRRSADAQALPPLREQRARRRQRRVRRGARPDPPGDARRTRRARARRPYEVRAGSWRFVCELDDILPDAGVARAGRRPADRDVPRRRQRSTRSTTSIRTATRMCSSRGIVGDLQGEPVVASPIYKHHFSLITGRCLEDPEHVGARCIRRASRDGRVWVKSEPRAQRRAHAQARRRSATAWPA